MTFRCANRTQPPVVLGIALRELAQQVLPLVEELAARDEQRLDLAHASYLAAIETITSPQRFCVDRVQITRYRYARSGMVAKALELRMMAIADREVAQHGTRQQRFAPPRDEPSSIEIARVQGP